jgi:hypothetical protein
MTRIWGNCNSPDQPKKRSGSSRFPAAARLSVVEVGIRTASRHSAFAAAEDTAGFAQPRRSMSEERESEFN